MLAQAAHSGCPHQPGESKAASQADGCLHCNAEIRERVILIVIAKILGTSKLEI